MKIVDIDKITIVGAINTTEQYSELKAKPYTGKIGDAYINRINNNNFTYYPVCPIFFLVWTGNKWIDWTNFVF